MINSLLNFIDYKPKIREKTIEKIEPVTKTLDKIPKFSKTSNLFMIKEYKHPKN